MMTMKQEEEQEKKADCVVCRIVECVEFYIHHKSDKNVFETKYNIEHSN